MTNWLCVVTPENYEIVAKKKIWGVEDRHRKTMEKVKKGEKLAFYIVGEKKIKDIYEATSEPYREEKQIFKNGTYPNRIKIKKIKEGEIEIDKIRDKMQIFKTRGKYWALALMGKAMIELDKNDWKQIEKNL